MPSEALRPETARTPENIVITPEALLTDNHSARADELRKKWETNKLQGKLKAEVACGDARISSPLRPEEKVTIRSIATAGPKEIQVFKSPGIELVLVVSHVDGETIEAGKKPKGCGGLGAKENFLNGNGEGENVRGINYYIAKRIEHPDPAVQAYITASRITGSTGKPSLVAIQDHRTSVFTPLAAILEGEVVANRLLADSLLKYDPSKLYQNGLPTLNKGKIPDIFAEVIEGADRHAKEMLLRYPNLREMQKIQNPRMVVLSTDLRPVGVRYPAIFDFPGLLFKFHVPREKLESGIMIKPEVLEESLSQTQYPIEFAVSNFGQPNKPFSKTNRVLIETRDVGVSRDLAAKLAGQEWMKKWLDLPDHQIVVVQTQEGISNIIEYFIPVK